MDIDVDEFGFIPIEIDIILSIGQISTLPDLAKEIKRFYGMANPDKYLYPPIKYQARLIKDGKFRKIPHSERAASMYEIPSSHKIRYSSAVNKSKSRHNVSGFLLHFIGFLFGYRVQFKDWHVDGRIYTKTDTDYGIPRKHVVQELVQHGFEVWQKMSPRQQTIMINILFLHLRSSTISSEWERFQAEYQVCDAIYAVARDSKMLLPRKKVSHSERINLFCETFSIPTNRDIIDKSTALRHDLIHEGLWDGGMPGEARSSDSFYTSLWLHRLTRRMIFSVLGFRGNYIRSTWWHMGTVAFEIEPAA